jgi:hypothetical protein
VDPVPDPLLRNSGSAGNRTRAFYTETEYKYNDEMFVRLVPMVLYRSKTWSLTLREEHRLRVFENRVLRRIFGPKRDEVTERNSMV